MPKVVLAHAKSRFSHDPAHINIEVNDVGMMRCLPNGTIKDCFAKLCQGIRHNVAN